MTVTQFAQHCIYIFGIDWVDIDGCIVVKQHRISSEVKKALRSGTPRTDVERLFNHAHMSILFSNFEDVPYTQDDALLIATIFSDFVRGRLHRLFPEKFFFVEILDNDDDVTVTYWQANDTFPDE
jgi:hypothetical protein